MRRFVPTIVLVAIVSAGFAAGRGTGDGPFVSGRADDPTGMIVSGRADDPTGQIVAEVDGEAISAAAFKEHYIAYLLRTGTEDEARLRRAVLAQMVNDRLLIAEAVAEGIEASADYRSHLETVRDKLAIELYLERQVLDTIRVTQADLEEAFVRINTQLTARHLFARTREEAEALYARLQSGESFEALARATFVDTTLANNGGAIGTFTFDETDPDFEDAAFGLAAGEISPPIRTAHGYSIIQVTDRFTKPILTELEFAEGKGELERLVIRKKRAQARTHFIRRIADDAAAEFHEPAFGRLLGQVTGTSMIESLEAFLEQPLVSFEGGTWAVEDFRQRAKDTDCRRRAAVRTEADLKEFITGLIVREELLERADPYRQEAEYESAVDGVMGEWILASKKQELAGSVEISAEELRAHYASHADEYHDGRPLSFDEAAPRIRQELLYQRTQETVLDYVAELRRGHEITVDDDALLELPIAGSTAQHSDSSSF